MIVNDELEATWREADVTYKKVNTPAYVQIDRENHTKRFIMTTGF
jgi:hypothetical protein